MLCFPNIKGFTILGPTLIHIVGSYDKAKFIKEILFYTQQIVKIDVISFQVNATILFYCSLFLLI